MFYIFVKVTSESKLNIVQELQIIHCIEKNTNWFRKKFFQHAGFQAWLNWTLLFSMGAVDACSYEAMSEIEGCGFGLSKLLRNYLVFPEPAWIDLLTYNITPSRGHDNSYTRHFVHTTSGTKTQTRHFVQKRNQTFRSKTKPDISYKNETRHFVQFILLGVGKIFDYLCNCAVFFSPDLFMKISNFSETVHAILTKFCTVILHPKGPLRVQRHQNRMTGMWET